MKRANLLNVVETLDADTPRHKELERALQIGVGFGSSRYSSQKQHWVEWLASYDIRDGASRGSAKETGGQYIYNQLNCPPMVFWLAEAAHAPTALLNAAYGAAVAAPKHHASQSAAIRKVIPWRTVETHLQELSEGGATRCNGHSDLNARCAKIATGCSQPEFPRRRSQIQKENLK